jgi:hypothetical protein
MFPRNSDRFILAMCSATLRGTNERVSNGMSVRQCREILPQTLAASENTGDFAEFSDLDHTGKRNEKSPKQGTACAKGAQPECQVKKEGSATNVYCRNTTPGTKFTVPICHASKPSECYNASITYGTKWDRVHNNIFAVVIGHATCEDVAQ